MKRVVVVGGLVILMLAGIGLYLGYVQNTKMANQQNEARSPQLTNNQAASLSDPQQPGTYIDYDKDALANAQGSRILFFYAPWCPQCRQLDEDIKKNTIPAGTTIIKVDYDSNQELRKKYGVTLQTSLVKIDESENLVDKYVAYNKPTLENVIQSLIQ